MTQVDPDFDTYLHQRQSSAGFIDSKIVHESADQIERKLAKIQKLKANLHKNSFVFDQSARERTERVAEVDTADYLREK